MLSATLSGDVYKLIDGKWRLVLTASGIPVVDGWKVPRDWREQSEFIQRPRSPRTTGAPHRGGFSAYWNGSPIQDARVLRMPYSGA